MRTRFPHGYHVHPVPGHDGHYAVYAKRKRYGTYPDKGSALAAAKEISTVHEVMTI